MDASDRKVRPAWPAKVCGYQQPPLAALAELREVGRELRFPIVDVDALTFCEYEGETQEAVGQTRLERAHSRDLLAWLASASAAQPCAETAQRAALARLLRPNGSGGGELTVELDGCQRASLDGGYRAVPPELVSALGG